MAQLHFTIMNQWIARTDKFRVVGKSRNYLNAEFEFLTDEWEGTATALFHSTLVSNPIEALIGQDGTCEVPHEVLDCDGEGEFFVSVFCGDLVTANKSRVRIYESGYSDDVESSEPPTPSVYAQIIDRMDGIEAAVEDATERTEAAAEKAELAVEHYPRIIDEYWYVWDAENEEFVNTNVQAIGDDGTSAFVYVTAITGGHRVDITDANGDHTFDVMDGRSIERVELISQVGNVDTYQITFNDATTFTYQVVNGVDGDSPTITVTSINNGHRLTITDKNGTQTVDVMNGEKGDTGVGIVSIKKFGSYENIDFYEITYTNGNKTQFNVTNAISPTIQTSTIVGGHRVTITDVNGTRSFDVMDGLIGFHICTSGEYNVTTRIPTIPNPNPDMFYLVPAESGSSPDLFVEWIYANNAWEMFGSASIDLTHYVQDSASVDGVALSATGDVVHYGICTSEAIAFTKVVSCPGFKLITGARIVVKFTATDDAGGTMDQVLNVNGTGAKQIRYRGSALTVDMISFNNGKVYEFVYDGTYYQLVGDLDTQVKFASATEIKAGTTYGKAIDPSRQSNAVFYGLAKASGDTTQKSSSNPVGTYTDSAKTAIRSMLGAVSSGIVIVSDTQPSDTENVLWMEDDTTTVEVPTMAELNAKASVSTATVTIAANDWSGVSALKYVTGVTTSNLVLVTYAPTSKDVYTAADIYCSGQYDGYLVFTCGTVPSESVTVNVIIINGAT